MLKYLMLFCVVLALSLYVSVHAHQHDQNAPVTPPDARNEERDIPTQQPHWNAPTWYALFIWPEGITVWALFLTFFAIAEQTVETKRSVENARRALILQYRPRIVIRRVQLSAESDNVELFIQNTGGSNAQITKAQFLAAIVDYRLPGFKLSDSTGSLAQFTLEPGEGQIKTIPLHGKVDEVTCIGTLWYRDDLGIVRTTGIHRKWNARWLVFIPIAGSDADYSD
jgi:hypothetical protein